MKKLILFLTLFSTSAFAQDCIESVHQYKKGMDTVFTQITEHWVDLLNQSNYHEFFKYWNPYNELNPSIKQEYIDQLSLIHINYHSKAKARPLVFPSESAKPFYSISYIKCDDQNSNYVAQIRIETLNVNGRYYISQLRFLNEEEFIEIREYLEEGESSKSDSLLLLPPPLLKKRKVSVSAKLFAFKKDSITFLIDTSLWQTMYSQEYENFLKQKNKKSSISMDHLIGFFTLKESVQSLYPGIHILQTKYFTDIPHIRFLEKELSAIPIPNEELRNRLDLDIVNCIHDFNQGRPIIVKEENLLLRESTVKSINGVTIRKREAILFNEKQSVSISISYILGKDDKYLQDFHTLIESLKF